MILRKMYSNTNTKEIEDKQFKKILIVDDEETLLFGFSKVLESPFMSVDTAQTVHKAKQLISVNFYHAVIVDLRLTGSTEMEGLEIVKFIRKVNSECTIIVLTAFSGKDIVERVNDVGAHFYFEKPISPGLIKNIIQSLD